MSKQPPEKLLLCSCSGLLELVIYICILSSVFDTSLNFFFWPLAFKSALHCLVCSPHRLSFRASSVDARDCWGKKAGEGQRERVRFFFSVKEESLNLNSVHVLLVFWADEPELKGYNSLARHHSHSCQWLLTCRVYLCFIRRHQSELAAGAMSTLVAFILPNFS